MSDQSSPVCSENETRSETAIKTPHPQVRSVQSVLPTVDKDTKHHHAAPLLPHPDHGKTHHDQHHLHNHIFMLHHQFEAINMSECLKCFRISPLIWDVSYNKSTQ